MRLILIYGKGRAGDHGANLTRMLLRGKARTTIVGVVALVTIASGMYVNDSGTYINDSGIHVSYFTEYLGNNPTTCNNCHVMDAVYEGWYHGDHKNHAVCADCHLPHDLVPKHIVKVESGFRDITAFISGNIPDTIRARESSQEIIQENCRRCHSQTVENIADGKMDSGRYCFDCHRTVAHGELGISLLPYQEG